jgi:hypothetical protein
MVLGLVLVGAWVLPQHGLKAQELCASLDLTSQVCLAPGDSADGYDVEVTETEDGEGGVVIVISGPAPEPVTVYTAFGTLPDGGVCWYLTTDETLAVHDPNAGAHTDFYAGVVQAGNPQCPYTPEDLALIESTFASIALQSPVVTTTPDGIGYTGFPLGIEPIDPLPTLTATTPPLSSGVTATVTATPRDIRIDWGDGSDSAHLPTSVAEHTYELKTCPPDYRVEHPRGHLCHPTLEAYPIDIAYRWTGVAVAPWGSIGLGTRTTTSTITRDIDEIIGVITK